MIFYVDILYMILNYHIILFAIPNLFVYFKKTS